MKKVLMMMSVTIAIAVCVTSCSSDDDCKECHLALKNADGTETMWEIENSTGGHEFCGNDLTTVEDSDYMYTVSEILISSDGNDTLQPGDYGASNGYEIHCEEHADH